ncbi:YciI family protein [Gilvimarinus sp. F26214L]|uniref:YciI family protein n=1 Tax=Gilvimarinus sp. DZF01 TaxID=3461371 RepID=UPI0040467845
MFIVLFRFSTNREQAGQYVESHKAWIKRGIDDGVFLVAGSLLPKQGGAVLAHNITLPELKNRVNDDPFVAESVVSAEILEVAPAMVSEKLQFLLG